jgi:two-component system chemotaxis response regulator CheB
MVPPHRDRDDTPWLIAIAASAGGISALRTILAGLPPTIPASVVIVQHRQPTPRSQLEDVLARGAQMAVTTANANEPVRPGVVYVARPDLHLTVGPDRRFTYIDGAKIRFVRSSANPLLDSAANVFGERTIAVVLTGSGLDATDGVQAVRARGGIVIAQDPATAEHASMPMSAIRTGAVDHVLPLEAIAPMLVAITRGRTVGRESV